MNGIHPLRRCDGVSIITAIFLLVVLSGMGVAIVTFATAQRQASALDLLGSRAYEAARTGVEYGLHRQQRSDVCADVNFAGSGNLAQMTISVTCRPAPTRDAAALTQTTITATACNQPAGGVCPNPAPGVDYVQRVVRVAI